MEISHYEASRKGDECESIVGCTRWRAALVDQQSPESSLSEVLVRQQGAGESSGVEVLPRLSWRGERG